MTHRLATNCAKNYCNWTTIVKVIVENVVTCFLRGRSVVSLEYASYVYRNYYGHSFNFFLHVLLSLFSLMCVIHVCYAFVIF